MKDDKGNAILLWNRDALGMWSGEELETLLEDAAERESSAGEDWKAVRAEQTERERRGKK